MDKLTICFELDQAGFERYRELLNKARAAAGQHDEKAVCEKADQLIHELADNHSSQFVREQANGLRTMLAMLRDEDFKMDPALRRPVVDALAYFVKHDDLVADDLPGLGHIDDAIMVVIVTDELEPELSAFEEFKSFRDAEMARRGEDFKVDRERFLADKRRAMFDRIQSRRARRAR